MKKVFSITGKRSRKAQKVGKIDWSMWQNEGICVYRKKSIKKKLFVKSRYCVSKDCLFFDWDEISNILETNLIKESVFFIPEMN